MCSPGASLLLMTGVYCTGSAAGASEEDKEASEVCRLVSEYTCAFRIRKSEGSQRVYNFLQNSNSCFPCGEFLP